MRTETAGTHYTHKVFARLLQKATPASARGAGNSEQGLAPRSKPAAANAARDGFGHRKRRRGRGAEPPLYPAGREMASRGWRRGQNRQPRMRRTPVWGTVSGSGAERQTPLPHPPGYEKYPCHTALSSEILPLFLEERIAILSLDARNNRALHWAILSMPMPIGGNEGIYEKI